LVLECAAVIGLTFTLREIECLSRESDELADCIETAKSLNILRVSSGALAFSHEVFIKAIHGC
jgi:hypothetical protein